MKCKTMKQHISCVCKYKCNSTTCNLNKKWNNKICQCECKKYPLCKRDYSWNPNKYLKSTGDTSVIDFGESISVMDIVTTRMANTIGTNVTRNRLSKKIRDCYILHTVLFNDHITFKNYYYLLSLCKE